MDANESRISEVALYWICYKSKRIAYKKPKHKLTNLNKFRRTDECCLSNCINGIRRT